MKITLGDTPVLTTERLHLRAPQAADWPAWRAMMASDRARYMGGPIGEEQAWRAFGHVIGHWVLRGFGSFIITRKGDPAALGMCGPWYPAGWPEPEIGWSLWSAAAEGQGLAAEAARAARSFAYDALGWRSPVSYIATENSRSIALAQRLGAQIDAGAATPRNEPCHVFRHPAPEVCA